jgi:hypothetical protein
MRRECVAAGPKLSPVMGGGWIIIAIVFEPAQAGTPCSDGIP